MEDKDLHKTVGTIGLNSRFMALQAESEDELINDLLKLVSDTQRDDMDTLDLAAYILVFSNLESNDFDLALEKYAQFSPTLDQQFETEILPNWSFFGIYKHRYNKLRMLSTAILSFFKNDEEKAKGELKVIFNKLLLRTEYRPVIKYINNLSCHGRDIPKYWDYLDSRFENCTEKNEIMPFMNYNMLYAYFAEQRVAERLNSFTKSKKISKLSNLIGIVDEIQDLVSFQGRIYVWIRERTEQEYMLVKSKDYICNQLNKHTVPIPMTIKRRVKLFLASLILSGELPSNFSEITTDSILENATGYSNGNVNAASLIIALDPFASEGEIMVGGEIVNNRFFELHYAFEYILLKRQGIDMETLLTTTTITYEDLEEIVLSYSLCGEFEQSIYRALLSPHLEFDTPAVAISNYEDVSNAFVSAKEHVIRGVISTALGKHLNLMCGELDSLYINQKVRLSSNEAVSIPKIRSDDKLTLANERIAQLEAELLGVQNEMKLMKIQAQNKEQILVEKLNVSEQEHNQLKGEHEILKANYDALFEMDDEALPEDLLEEDVFEIESEVVDDKSTIDYIEEMRGLKICVVGGFVNFHNNIRESFPTEPTFVESRFYNYPLSMLLKQDIVVHVAVHNNHPHYKRVRNYMKRHNCKDRFFVINAQHGPELLAKKIYEYRKKKEIEKM